MIKTATILTFLVLLLYGCVSTSQYQELEKTNNQLISEVKIYKQAESGKLVEDYKNLKNSMNLLYRQSVIEKSAFEYLKNEGWGIVIVEGIIKVKKNEYDYVGTEYLVVHNVGIFKETVLYEERLGRFLMINSGPNLAKHELFGIKIIDSQGRAQSFSEYKRIK